MERPIERRFRNDHPHWVGNGFHVRQYFPNTQSQDFYQRFSPFLLLDYNPPEYFPAAIADIGVGPHPHRGFETVTLSIAGKIAHGDNQGNHGIIESGDVQWMTAGKGILHKEYHERGWAKKDRVFHMIQLWVNLPSKDKMTTPNYQGLKREDMGTFTTEKGSTFTVVAGEVNGVQGPASTFSPIHLYRVEMAAEDTITLNEPEHFNTGLLVLSGKGKVGDENVHDGDFLLFENRPGEITVKTDGDELHILVLSGEPLNEPVAAMGPFVMNTVDELIQANTDFNEGRFGSLRF